MSGHRRPLAWSREAVDGGCLAEAAVIVRRQFPAAERDTRWRPLRGERCQNSISTPATGSNGNSFSVGSKTRRVVMLKNGLFARKLS